MNRPVPTAEALADVAATPLSDAELVPLFAPLAGARRIALAISGGGDSLALLDAIDRWRRAPSRPSVVVLTVDHRLQPASSVAAEMVLRLAGERGLEARVLTRDGDPPTANVEADARAARYRLLFAACHDAGASHLVVAHQQDDVAETFLMRLKRGAGVFGLAAMRAEIAVGGVMLFRPFLGVPRARLAATVAVAGWTPIDDPMNTDPRFARTHARTLVQRLDAAPIATLALRFAELAETIDAATDAFLADAVTVDAFAVAWVDAARFAGASDEVGRRALVRLLLATGGSDYPPRADRLDALLMAMHAPAARRLKRTLGSVVIEQRAERFAFYRETGRQPRPAILVAAGQMVTWDCRFAVAAGGEVPAGATVGPLGEAGRREIGAVGSQPVPAAAIAVLPALRDGAEILAVPHFRNGPVAFQQVVSDLLRRRPLFPDFAGG